MPSLSTHVLDTSLGHPAAGIPVRLERNGEVLAQAVTDRDGRVGNFELSQGGGTLAPGSYSLVFMTAEYFAARRVEAFYLEIVVRFIIRDDAHYHVPVLLSPFGYSTYRGS